MWPGDGTAQAREREDALQKLAFYEQELDVVSLLLDAGAEFPPCRCVFRNASVVDPVSGSVRRGLRVVVDGGRFVRVGADDDGPAPPGFREIDLAGRYLSPGLTDMHVHSLTSASTPLLHVATGVTAVREMVGFPFLLEWRRQSAVDGWLAPSMAVASPIISSRDMGEYSTRARDASHARVLVRQHAAAGYDFIKVHNVLEPELFLAVLDEAAMNEIDVVGHVPHDVSVTVAAEGGLVTLEHLKGYVDDRTLTIADDDWVLPTRRLPIWNTPTLYAHRLYLNVDEAREWLATEEARYAPALLKREWLGYAPETGSPSHRALLDKKLRVLTRLRRVTRRFLAGTDAGGGYPFMVPGLALHEELRLLKQAGFDDLEVLRAATTYAAEAMGRSDDFGRVAAGLRADLVVSELNPLDDIAALRHPEGVLVRGRWIDREGLDSILDRLATIYASVPALVDADTPPDQAWAEALVARMEGLRERGYMWPGIHRREIEAAFRTLGIDPSG